MSNKPVLATINARLDVLERKVLGHVRRRVSRNEKARLEGVTPRTIARRVKAGLIEPPDIVNGRWYFWIDEAEQPRPEPRTVGTLATKAARDPRLRKPTQTSPEIR
jgi:hypothetical protein